MNAFDLAAIFLAVVAATGWINARFLHLPTAAVMVLAGLAVGGLLLLARTLLPDSDLASALIVTIQTLNFPETVLGYMLAFLLFAGAMQVDFAALRKEFWSVFTLSTVGVVASTAVVGVGLWVVARSLGLKVTLPWAMVFGALISPTDPIAVVAAVRRGSLTKTLEVVLQGEALFNDGVGIVVFTAALAIATTGGQVNPFVPALDVAAAAAGGVAVGWLASWGVTQAISVIDDYAVEVVLTVALAIGVYALADAIHVSAPIAVVVAGLVVGARVVRSVMSEITQRYVRGFWTLVDEILNALLFLMLGLETLVVHFDVRLAGVWAAAIALVLVTRLLVVLPWGAFFQRRGVRGASALLTWGGLHGALSLALALTLPSGRDKVLILSTTFAVVIFSVVVQSVSFSPLAAAVARRAER
jgi:CPA1 family monovalent cation:H+ antiporter